jgi:hypothetical protein
MLFNLLVILGVFGSQFFMISTPVKGDEFWVYYWLILVALSSFVFVANRKVDVRWMGAVLFFSLLSALCNRHAVQFAIYLHVFFNIFLGCFAVKTIAERFTISMKQLGSLFFWMWVVVHGVLALQYFGFLWKDYQLSGFYTMPWMMGSAALLSIPFIRKLKVWFSAILILPIAMSHSMAIVTIALVMWVQPRLKWSSILLVGGLALSYILLFDRGIDHARLAVIERSSAHIHNWITGDGVGSWAHKAFVRRNGEDLYYWRWAHNELYQMVTETGFLGGLSVLAVIFNLFKRISTEQKYYLFGIVAMSMVHPIFHIPRLIPFIIVILALMVRRKSVED